MRNALAAAVTAWCPTSASTNPQLEELELEKFTLADVLRAAAGLAQLTRLAGDCSDLPGEPLSQPVWQRLPRLRSLRLRCHVAGWDVPCCSA